MTEDFPHPEVPQRATTLFFSLSTLRLTPFKTITSFFEGYWNLTFISSMTPLES